MHRTRPKPQYVIRGEAAVVLDDLLKKVYSLNNGNTSIKYPLYVDEMIVYGHYAHTVAKIDQLEIGIRLALRRELYNLSEEELGDIFYNFNYTNSDGYEWYNDESMYHNVYVETVKYLKSKEKLLKFRTLVMEETNTKDSKLMLESDAYTLVRFGRFTEESNDILKYLKEEVMNDIREKVGSSSE